MLERTLLVNSANNLEILLINPALKNFDSAHSQPYFNFSSVQLALIDKMKTPKQLSPLLLGSKKYFLLKMSALENVLELSLPSIAFKQQALITTESNDYKEPVSPQSSLFAFFQKNSNFTEVKDPLHGYNPSVSEEMEFQEASISALLPLMYDSKTQQKKILHLILQSTRKGKTKF